jgi:hypothetical protein
MSDAPSPNGRNRRAAGSDRPPAASKAARGAGGRFGPGNPGGPGNPFARAVGRLRAALIAAVSDEDIGEIVHALVAEAKAGNVMAAREVLDRCLGRPVEADLLVRLEELEAAVAASQERAP